MANDIFSADFSKDSSLDIFNDITNTFDKYIVRPANSFGLAGFVFDLEGDTDINLSTEITDHYTENNSAVQDHIAVRPKRITLKNSVGELVYRQDESTNNALEKAVQKLTVIDSYLPTLSNAGQQIKDALEGTEETLSFNNLLNDATDIWGLTKNLNPPIPRQQQAYMYFKALCEQKILVSLQTPFEFATSMAIESVSARQEESSQWISDFTITLKEIRMVSTKTVPFEYINDVANLSPIAGQQASPTANNGAVQGSVVTKPVDSVLSTIWSEFAR